LSTGKSHGYRKTTLPWCKTFERKRIQSLLNVFGQVQNKLSFLCFKHYSLFLQDHFATTLSATTNIPPAQTSPSLKPAKNLAKSGGHKGIHFFLQI
jgi:hypothetical protein